MSNHSLAIWSMLTHLSHTIATLQISLLHGAVSRLMKTSENWHRHGQPHDSGHIDIERSAS